MRRLSERNPTHEDLELCVALILEEAGFEKISFDELMVAEGGRPLGDVDVYAERDGEVYGFEVKSHEGLLDNGHKRNVFYRAFGEENHFFEVYQRGQGIYIVNRPARGREGDGGLLDLIDVEEISDAEAFAGSVGEYLEDAA